MSRIDQYGQIASSPNTAVEFVVNDPNNFSMGVNGTTNRMPLSFLDARYPKVIVSVPAPTGATATDTPNITAAISTFIAALESGPASLVFQDGTYQLDSNSAIIRSPNTTTVGSSSNEAEPSTWVPGSPGTLTVASTTGFPSFGQLWLAASGSTVALISYTGTTSTTFTGCLYLGGSATGTLATGGAVTGSLSNFTIKSAGRTILEQAPNRTGANNNVSGDIFIIADCTDFSVEDITLDGDRDFLAPITPLTATAAASQPSVTVAAGQGANYIVGQRLMLFGGLGSADQNKYDGGFVGRAGDGLTISSIAAGGGSGGGDLITFSTNLTNSYSTVSGSLVTDGFGPYACTGAYVTPYQTGSATLVGRTLIGEDQQCGLHLINCQRFTIKRLTVRNVWESPIRLGTGFQNSSLTDGCSVGVITDCVAYHGYDQGVAVWVSNHITVKGCEINAAGWAAVSLTSSDNCTVTANPLLGYSVYQVPSDIGDGIGVAVEGGKHNRISGNVITSPMADGVRLTTSPMGWGQNSGTAPTLGAYLAGNTAAGTSVQVSSSSVLQVGGLYSIIDGSRTEAVTVATIVDSTHVTFTEVTKFSHASGIYISNRVAQENYVTDNNIITPQLGNGVAAQLSARSVIKHNTIRDWALASGGFGFGVALNYSNSSLPSGVYLAANGSIIEGNVVGGGENNCMRADTSDHLTVTGNRMYGPSVSAAPLLVKGVTDSTFSGNTITDVEANNGIEVQVGGLSSTTPARCVFSGNVISRTFKEGLLIIVGDSLTITENKVSGCGGNAGIDLRGVSNSIVDSNVTNSNQAAGILLEDQSTTYCLGNRVTNNTCRDDGSGFNVQTGVGWTQQYGIEETGHSNNNLYTGNELDSNGTAQIATVGIASYAYANIISGTPTGALPSQLGGNVSELLRAPTGATAQTFPRYLATTSPGAISNGVLNLFAILIPAGTVVNNITFLTGATLKTGGTHGWYVLCDSSRVVRAVTADQTDPATVWGTAHTAYTIAVAASYTATYTGLYYVGIMVATTAGTQPSFEGFTGLDTGTAALTPLLNGNSNTGETTPPTTGTTMNAITSTTASPYYGYTS